MGFEVLEWQFQLFERDLKLSNANSNHLNSIWMPILTIRMDSTHSHANSNQSKGAQSIKMPIPTIRTVFEALECIFQPFELESKHSIANSTHSNGFEVLECKFQPLEWDSKHSNAN